MEGQPAKYVPIVVFYPPAVGHDDCPFPTVRQFTHTAELAMPTNSTHEAASEAQSFLPFNALKVRKRLSPFGELLNEWNLLPARNPRSDAGRRSGRAAIEQCGLAASPRGRREGTTTCLIAAQPVICPPGNGQGLGGPLG